MKFKKLTSLALAGALSFSLAAPAFASGNETEITGSYTAPVIAVEVTTTAKAFINPLGLDIDVATGVTVSGRQIISAPMTIKNQSAMDLQVDASMTAIVNEGSDMRFVSTTTGGTGATKTVFAYLQAKQEPTLTGADSAVDATAVGTAYAAWDAVQYNADTDLLVNSALATSKTNLVVVRAADTSGAAPEYKAGSVALVRLAGDCVASPTVGSWTETGADSEGNATGDGFTVNVAYTFKPAAITKYDVSVDTSADAALAVTSDVTKAAAGDTVTLTVTNLGSLSTVTIAVKDKDNAAVTTTPANGQVTTANGTVSFVMPEGGVTITAS